MRDESKTEKTKEVKEGFYILIRHLKQYKSYLIFLLILGVISPVIAGVIPYIFGLFIDAITDVSKTLTVGGIVITAWVGILILWVFLKIISDVASWFFGKSMIPLYWKVLFDYQTNAINHILLVPISFHKDERGGELWHHINNASNEITSITARVLPKLSIMFLELVVGIIIVSFINPFFTVIIILSILVYILFLIRLFAPLQKLSKESRSIWEDADGNIGQSLTNIVSVKHMTAEKYEENEITKIMFKRLFPLRYKVDFIRNTSDFYQQLIILVTPDNHIHFLYFTLFRMAV